MSSASVTALGTYRPAWIAGANRIAGPDEDTVTMAVAAGRAALEATGGSGVDSIVRVQFVTGDPPLVEGGNGPALLAGLGLTAAIEVIEQLGGAPAALDAVAGAPVGTLVLAADLHGEGQSAGGAAALIGPGGGRAVTASARVNRSLPLRARGIDGVTHEDDDPRLVRERGLRASLSEAGIEQPATVVSGGASAPLFALTEPADDGTVLVAVEQARLVSAAVGGELPPVRRDERSPRAQPVTRTSPGPEIKLVFSAYDRAFAPKLRLEAAGCVKCGTLSYPPRYRCLECGTENDTVPVALERGATVYSTTTVRVPVPGLAVPYSLAIVELDDTGVRLLAPVTDVEPGETAIGDLGDVVFRRLSIRSGIPDYGYAFRPVERVAS